jgi:hypothetical protein
MSASSWRYPVDKPSGFDFVLAARAAHRRMEKEHAIRNLYILSAYKNGSPVTTIALTLGMTRRGIHSILAKQGENFSLKGQTISAKYKKEA